MRLNAFVSRLGSPPAALVLAVVLLLSACDKRKAGSSEGMIAAVGSNTMVNLAQMWAEAYRDVDSKVSVDVKGGGSNVGIRKLEEEERHVRHSATRHVMERTVVEQERFAANQAWRSEQSRWDPLAFAKRASVGLLDDPGRDQVDAGSVASSLEDQLTGCVLDSKRTVGDE